MQLTDFNRQDGASPGPFADHVPPAGEPSGFDKVLNGLMVVLDSEKQALEDKAPVDFAGFTRQKLQLLMQLDRLAAAKGPAAMPAATGQKLVETRRKLDENARILKHRMEAIREIADLISEEIRDADSDGTYSIRGSAQSGHRR